MTISEIQEEMLVGRLTPNQIAEYRTILSAKFSEATDRLEEVLMIKPELWNQIRPEFKSDTACEKAWEATDEGRKERHWRFQIKKIEKMMSALKTQWEVLNAEAKNIV